MGNIHARKSCAVLIVITATRYATSSTHLYLCVRSHEVVKRYQYASTGEQVKIRASIHAGPYAATTIANLVSQC
jgi:hypothetical protein